MVPHEGRVITMRLTGEEIIEVLEQAIENVITEDRAVKVGGMIQVGGLRFRYDPTLLKDQRVLHVEMPQDRWNSMDKYCDASASVTDPVIMGSPGVMLMGGSTEINEIRNSPGP